MKKFTAIVLTILLSLISLCSCETDGKTMPREEGKLNIVTTIFPYYDYTKNIIGGMANLKMLLSPGAEPHNYEPSPSDIIDINNADLFIYTGGESDEWAESIIDSLDSSVRVLKLIDCINPIYEEEPDKTKGEEYDEHIWTSPENAIIITQAISKEIMALDENNREYFEKNTENYLSELKNLDDKFIDIVKNSKRNKIVFGDRFPVLYLVKELNLDYECAFPGCSSETEPGITTVKRLIDAVRIENIPAVFYLDFSNEAVAKLLCEDSNAKPLVYHSCHNVTADDFNSGATYISLMEKNAEALKEALN